VGPIPPFPCSELCALVSWELGVSSRLCRLQAAVILLLCSTVSGLLHSSFLGLCQRATPWSYRIDGWRSALSFATVCLFPLGRSKVKKRALVLCRPSPANLYSHPSSYEARAPTSGRSADPCCRQLQILAFAVSVTLIVLI
jgi:hypothetical protein